MEKIFNSLGQSLFSELNDGEDLILSFYGENNDDLPTKKFTIKIKIIKTMKYQTNYTKINCISFIHSKTFILLI